MKFAKIRSRLRFDSNNFGIDSGKQVCPALSGVVRNRPEPSDSRAKSSVVVRSRPESVGVSWCPPESVGVEVFRGWPSKQRPVYEVHAQSEGKKYGMKYLIISTLYPTAPIYSDRLRFRCTPIDSGRLRTTPNDSRRHQTTPNDSGRLQITPNGDWLN